MGKGMIEHAWKPSARPLRKGASDPASLPGRSVCAAVKELGFDYRGDLHRREGRASCPARLDADRARRAPPPPCANTGVPIQSMCLSGHRRFPYGSADRRRAAHARMRSRKRPLTVSLREFGIRVIQLAGYDVYYEPSTPESRCGPSAEGLRSACEIAEK